MTTQSVTKRDILDAFVVGIVLGGLTTAVGVFIGAVLL